MNLDVEVSKLRLLKSSFQSQKYTLEDNLARYFPREIAETKAWIAALESDIGMRDTHPVPADGFAGVELDGVRYTERIAAGEALLNLLPTVQDTKPVHVGSFRGFEVEVSLEQFGNTASRSRARLGITWKLGADALGKRKADGGKPCCICRNTVSRDAKKLNARADAASEKLAARERAHQSD